MDVIDLTGDSSGGKTSRVRNRRSKASTSAAPEVETIAQPSPQSKGTGVKRKAKAARGTQKPAAKKQKENEVVEKRSDAHGHSVRWYANPTIATRDRISRALPGSGHRMFLIDRKMLAPPGSEGGAAEEFAVLGATANVYQVKICRHPSCTCPDFAKGNLCKHILFVMLRVLRLPKDDPLVWQKAFLTAEVDEVLGGHRSTRKQDVVLADERVLQTYRQLSGGGCGSSSDGSVQRPIEGDCAICFDELEATDKVVFCPSCGNNVHQECFQRWRQSRSSQGQTVTCVYCRAPWKTADAESGKEQYVNLAQYSDAHRGADTSLEALYGDSSLWIRSHAGHYSRRQAANMWRAHRGH